MPKRSLVCYTALAATLGLASPHPSVADLNARPQRGIVLTTTTTTTLAPILEVCDLVTSVATQEEPSILTILNLEIDYSSCPGEFADGGLFPTQCEDLVMAPLTEFRLDVENQTLRQTWVRNSGTVDNGDVSSCAFESTNAMLDADCFALTLIGTGDGNGSVPGVSVSVRLENCESTVTTTTTSTTTSTSTSTSTTTTTLSTAKCGDPNGDGTVASDALFILNAGVGLRSCALCLCDLDGNGSITATDALATLRLAVGLTGDPQCPAC